VLYHLAKAGWTDIMLIERSELTSGSTWHAAGGFHTLNGDPNVAKLQAYTIGLYEELEKMTGQSCSLHLTGGVRWPTRPERMDFLRLVHAKGRYLGMETELVTPSEAKAMFPIMDETNFVGALWDPVEGHLDPSGTTHAYAKAARMLGAEIVLRNPVKELTQEPDGTWNVVTEQGTVKAEHVVNAGGLWAREVGRMVGLELPVLAMEHMYLLTEDMPEVIAFNEASGRELMPRHRLQGRDLYAPGAQGHAARHLRAGLRAVVAGQDAVGFRPRTAAAGHRPHRAVAGGRLPHFPALERAGIKQIINGPFTFAPDGNPLVGPVPGLTNFWSACAVMAGFSQGGGVGLTLANWMTWRSGRFDVWGMDVSRFGEWATLRYTNAKVRENYSRRFSHPLPERGTAGGAARADDAALRHHGRPERGDGRQLGAGDAAVVRAGRSEAHDIVSFHRSNDFEHVGAEVRAVRTSVGVTEIANFAKYEVSGPGAEDFLNRLMTNRMPKTGRIVLTPMLNEFGKLIGDFTIAKAGDDRFMVWGSSAAQKYHMRWFERTCRGTDRSRSTVSTRPGGPVDRRAEQPRGAGKARRRGRLQRGVPLHGFPRDGGGGRAVHGQPDLVYRRSRLRDLDGAGL
jgi:dimethylglycine dehydrogenase